MKVQDLMIGDWIAENIDEEGCDFLCCWVSHQVNADDFKFWDENDWIDVDNKCFSEFWRPIPLTSEILEKNGFVKQEDGCFRYFKSYDENYYFGFESISYLFERKTAKITKEHSQSGIQEKVEFTCEYLHELQHALRLCGIDKEIEL